MTQTPETLRAFERAKELMCSPPVLRIFNPQHESILECDASLKAAGVCLKQRSPDGATYVVAYHSQQFNAAQQRYCVTRRECLSVVIGLARFKTWLLDRKVIVTTDHSSLEHIMKSKNLSAQMMRYREFLSDFDITIEYVPGSQQVISDYLSRMTKRACDGDQARCRQCRAGRGTDDDCNDIEHGLHAPRLTCSANEHVGVACRVQTRSQSRRQADGPVSSDQDLAGLDQTNTSLMTSAQAATSQDDRGGNSGQENIVSDTQTDSSAPNSPSDHVTDADLPRTRRRRRRNILQQAAPLAFQHISNNHWSTEYIVEQQKKDDSLAIVRQWFDRGERPNSIPSTPDLRDYWLQFNALKMENDILYRQFFNPNGQVAHLQVLIPVSLRPTVLELVHTSTGHAQTVSKNESAFARCGYFPHWRKTLKIFLLACRRCLEYARSHPAKQGPLQPTAPTIAGPGELLSIDLVGKLPMSAGFSYVLTAQDVFTKYVFLIPLRDKTAQHVTDALMRIFLSHGFYPLVKSDLGSEFIHAVQSDLDKVTQSVRITTTAYTPRNNPVERCHRELHAILGKLIDDHKKWSDVLTYVQFVYNTTQHLATNFTPAFLHFGRELSSSLNLLLPTPSQGVSSYGEFAQNVVDNMRLAIECARETLLNAAEMASRTYNRHVKPVSFAEGTSVLVYYPRKFEGKFSKWQRLYSIEGRVVKRLSDVTYVIYDKIAKRNRIVHVDKMRLLPSLDCNLPNSSDDLVASD